MASETGRQDSIDDEHGREATAKPERRRRSIDIDLALFVVSN
jgi:hypothetical protein